MGTIYLLHFARPLGNPTTPHGLAQHYLGWAADWRQRNRDHLAGRGAAITRAALARGITWECYPLLPGDRTIERYLKSRKETPRLCPICGHTHRRGPLVLHWRQLELPLDDLALLDRARPSGPDYGWYGYFAPRRTEFGTAALDTSTCDLPY